MNGLELIEKIIEAKAWYTPVHVEVVSCPDDMLYEGAGLSCAPLPAYRAEIKGAVFVITFDEVPDA